MWQCVGRSARRLTNIGVVSGRDRREGMHVPPVDISLTEYTKLQEQECRALLQLLGEMGIATADRIYGPGDAIYNQGEYGDALYVLTSGVLKLFRPYSGSKEATLRLLKPW